jgi:hypothetical protein
MYRLHELDRLASRRIPIDSSTLLIYSSVYRRLKLRSIQSDQRKKERCKRGGRREIPLAVGSYRGEGGGGNEDEHEKRGDEVAEADGHSDTTVRTTPPALCPSPWRCLRGRRHPYRRDIAPSRPRTTAAPRDRHQ